MRLIDANAVIRCECGQCDGCCNIFDGDYCLKCTSHNKCQLREAIDDAPTVDAIPIDDMAEMLAESFGDECCCNYNRTDEWLPELCEHSETCPDVIGKNGCWKQFIKHWMKRKMDGGKQDAE